MEQERPRNVGSITLVGIDTEALVASIIVQEKTPLGEPEPDPELVVLTPSIIEKLAKISAADMQTERVAIDVFGNTIVWLQHTVLESDFHGRDITFEGPYLLDTKKPDHPSQPQLSPDSIEVRYRDEGQVVIAYRGKEVDNQKDPDEVVVVLTPESVQNLKKISAEEINRGREDSEVDEAYIVYDVFDSRVAFQRSRVHEDFAHGWITDFSGPFLIQE